MIISSAGKSVDLLVVGGGIVGTAIALLACSAGWDVCLIERRPQLGGNGQRVFTLHAPAVRLLRQLGVWNKLHTTLPVRAMTVITPNGQNLHIDQRSAGRAQLCYTVQESDLGMVLTKLVRESEISVLTGVSLESLVAGDEWTTADIAGKAVHARLVIGADGRNSRVAELAGLTARNTRNTGQLAIVTTAAMPAVGHTAWQWLSTTGMLAFLPSIQGRVGIIWSRTEKLARTTMALSCEDFAAAVQEASEGQAGLCSDCKPLLSFALTGQMRTPVGIRIALVGDSAHVFHPLAGQGLAVGLGDVIDLLAAIADGDPGRSAALAHYRRVRYLRVLGTQWLTDMIASLPDPNVAIVPNMLDLGARLPISGLLAQLANAK